MRLRPSPALHHPPQYVHPASVIIEDRDIPRRVRRPLDLARFVLALVITAATVMTSAPLLIAFLLFQRQFVQSFMRAGIR